MGNLATCLGRYAATANRWSESSCWKWRVGHRRGRTSRLLVTGQGLFSFLMQKTQSRERHPDLHARYFISLVIFSLCVARGHHEMFSRVALVLYFVETRSLNWTWRNSPEARQRAPGINLSASSMLGLRMCTTTPSFDVGVNKSNTDVPYYIVVTLQTASSP